jgi:hypothetical protein
MKKILLVFSLFLFNLSVNAQGTWVSQATGFTPVSSGVRYVSPVDTNIVWICSYDGSAGGANRQDFSRTIDGGMNWTAGVVPVPASHDWGMIFALNADTAWSVFYDAVATNGGGIWKTMDGGVTWAQQDSGLIYDATSFPNVVHFWDADTGWTMGDPNTLDYEMYTTVDGGDNWVRVPLANVPPPLNGEYGIVGHYNVIGDTIWFDTNKGRVYRSIDKGLNWTVSSTGIIVPVDGAIDICFNSHLEGLVRLYNNTTGVNTVKHTTDGGDTWTATTITGTLFGSDIKYVPGTAAKMISTGAATGFIGSSYSNDGGHTWVTIETADQRTALGVVDSLTMWAGGFTVSPSDGGIYKFEFLEPVLCSDTAVSPGTAVASDTLVCANDTLVVTSTGVFSPTVGDFYGVSWVISSADITGSVNPVLEPSLVATYQITSPSTPTSIRLLINDGTLIGSGTPYGVYYWTPVVFANASAVGVPVFLGDLTLDPACTFTGNSVAADIAAPGDPRCSTVGISKIDAIKLAVYAFQENSTTIKLHINAAAPGNTRIEMYDITGRQVYNGSAYVSKGTNIEMISIADLRAGTYMIKAVSNGTQTVTKLIVF